MKKSVHKSPVTKSAVVSPGRVETHASEALYTAAGIPEDIGIEVKRFYSINVRKFGAYFRLYDFNQPCGARLWKGDGFPLEAHLKFTGPSWVETCFYFDSLESASAAAELLQDYLDNCENTKLEAAMKRYVKRPDYIPF